MEIDLCFDRALRATLKSLALAATLASTVPASADEDATEVPAAALIDDVSCDGRDDFLRATLHIGAAAGIRAYRCWASSGEYWLNGETWWVTEISTGNNRVQWFGDGRWQPDEPIDAWTLYSWPNNPGGVRIEGVRILDE